MSIVVRLKPKIAQAFHKHTRRSDLEPAALDLLNTLDHYGASIRPQHLGAADPELAGFFLVEGAKENELPRLRDTLGALEAVDAAYEKPQPEMP